MSKKPLYFMKPIIAFCLMALFSVASSEEKSQPFCKVENVVISYEYYGNDKGETTIKIKDYGAFVLRKDNRIMTSYGEEKEYRYFCLMTPSAFYQADLHDSNMAVKIARPANMEDIILFHEILYGKQADSLETEKRYQKRNDESVAGQLCHVYHDNTEAVTYWVWNNIILKEESVDWETKKPSGKRAVSVNVNPEFEKDAFSLPEELEVI
jgi:hypothetical protein